MNNNFEMKNLYDYNRELVDKEKFLSIEKIKKRQKQIAMAYCPTGCVYFMLLCKELSDYTLFHLPKGVYENYYSMTEELIECLENRGKIIAIQQDNNNSTAFEIWIKLKDSKEKPRAYYLFPYDAGVIEC